MASIAGNSKFTVRIDNVIVRLRRTLFECAIDFWRALAASPYIGHEGEEEVAKASYQLFPRIGPTIGLFGSDHFDWPPCHYPVMFARVGGVNCYRYRQRRSIDPSHTSGICLTRLVLSHVLFILVVSFRFIIIILYAFAAAPANYS